MAKLSSGKMKKLLTLALVAVGIFLLLNHFLFAPKKKKEAYDKAMQEQQQAAENSEGAAEEIPVKVMAVVRHDFVDSLEALGSIKGGVEFKLTFQIPGTIKAINYLAGEKYKKGALLMSLDDEDIILRMKRVEAARNKAQIAVDIAQQKLEEHQKLFKIGAISKTTLEKIQLELESAQYDMEAAVLEVKANEAVLDKSNLYAISDGMIGELFVEKGEVISSNTLIGTHILTEYVKAEFGVIERDMAKLKQGQAATIYGDAYQDKAFQGVVESIAPVVGGTSRTATISVKIDNKDGLLLPGMFARIRVDLYSKRDTLIIPTEAVINDEAAGGAFVFVLDEETSQVKKVLVKVGYTRSDFSQIDEGIQEGQLICVTSVDRLEDGKKVEVIEKQTLELE